MTMGRSYYYSSASSPGEINRQKKLFLENGAAENDIVFEKSPESRETYEMLRNTFLRTGDTLFVAKLSSLGINKKAEVNELKYYKEKGIRTVILEIPSTAHSFQKDQEWAVPLMADILIEVLAVQAEHEKEVWKQEQSLGIAAAKAEGKYQGGKRKEIDEKLYQELYEKYLKRETNKVKMAKKLGVSRPTLDLIIERHNSKQ